MKYRQNSKKKYFAIFIATGRVIRSNFMHIYKNSIFNSNLYNSPSFASKNKDAVKVSVVVPVCNQEKYLPKALDSLKNQSLEETEFICVNDGSTDSSLDIMKDYASKDKRVKIIDQKNRGSGPARNIGMYTAQGKYVAFLDPDDWFDKDALKTVYQKAEEQNCDMVVFNYKNIDEKTGIVTPGLDVGSRIRKVFPEFDESQNFTWQDIKPKVFLTLLLMAWNKLFDRKLIQDAQLGFSNCSLAEDNVFVFGAILNAKKIGYLNKGLYNYLQHEGSAVHTKTDKNLCIFESIDDVKTLIANMGLSENLKAEFDDYVLRILALNAKQILSHEKLKEMCKQRLSSTQVKALEDKKYFIG